MMIFANDFDLLSGYVKAKGCIQKGNSFCYIFQVMSINVSNQPPSGFTSILISLWL